MPTLIPVIIDRPSRGAPIDITIIARSPTDTLEITFSASGYASSSNIIATRLYFIENGTVSADIFGNVDNDFTPRAGWYRGSRYAHRFVSSYTFDPSAGDQTLTIAWLPYHNGGWMFTTTQNTFGTEVPASNPAICPIFDVVANPPSYNVNTQTVSVIKTFTQGGVTFKTLRAQWINPIPLTLGDLTFPASLHVFFQNYFNDGNLRTIPPKQLNTPPAGLDFVEMTLETDAAAPVHNVTFYFVPESKSLRHVIDVINGPMAPPNYVLVGGV